MPLIFRLCVRQYCSFCLLIEWQQVYKSTCQAILKSSKYNSIQLMSSEGDALINLACSKIKDEDITHRGFLKPIEIQLKTYKTEIGVKGSKLKPTSLPAGLKIAVKQSILNNKYSLQDIQPIVSDSKFQQLKERSQDNILTLMKSVSGLELAICICMYSEDKKMLKSTLAGVAENISNLVTKEHISSDKIGVFVLMDGIEKVEETVVDYFEELERMNNINLGTNTVPELTIQEMARRSKMTENEINEEETNNVNNFIFDPAELQQRNQRRFSSVHHEYLQIKKLLTTINKLKKEKPLYDDLPNKLHPFFINEARQQYKKQYSETDEVVKKFSEEKLLAEYANDIRKIRPLILRTLNEGERYCHEYINSREDLAYLVSFRQKVRHSIDKLPKNLKEREKDYHQHSREQLVDELEQSQFHTHMNLFLCVKYKNSGKLSSHNWFFNGFCQELKPKYAVLLDVGLKPEGQALQKMYKYMKKNRNVGGVCGYMSLKIEKLEQSEQVNEDEVDFLTNIAFKFADIQRTQQVEYHFAHLMDKPFEASFGFIHVLPGAFSAYNMEAIIKYNQQDDDELLKSYFKSIDEKMKNNKIVPSSLSISNVMLKVLLPDFVNSCCIDIDPESEEQMLYNQNIFLAEDRILCMGIHKKGFDMTYLPDAYAQVDPIKTVHGLLGQRKRWINGSFFAFQKVKKELKAHQQKNSFECMLHLQMFYLTLMNSLSYFAPSFFFFTVHIAMEAFRADVLTKVLAGNVPNPNQSEFYNGFVYTIDFIYALLILSVIFFSLHLTNNNKKFKPFIYAVSTLFGIFSIIVFLVLLVDVIRGLTDSAAFLVQNEAFAGDIPGGVGTIDIMRWILIGTTLVYAIPILIYVLLFKKANILWEIILGSFSFIFYGPTYLNILNIYSLCRIDDISWGTKGLDSAGSANSKLKDSWKLIKFVHVSKYVFWNIILSVVLLSLGSSYAPRFFITLIIVCLMGSSLGIKIIIGMLYVIKYKMTNTICCGPEEKIQINQISKMQQLINSYKGQIMGQIKSHLNDMKKQYISDPKFRQKGGSFIQVAKKAKLVEKAYKKQKQEKESQSKIHLKSIGQKLSLANANNIKRSVLAPIAEQFERQTSKKKPSHQRLPSLSSEDSPQKQRKSQDGLLTSKNPQLERDSDNVMKSIQKGFAPVEKSKQKKFQKKGGG